MGGGCPIDLWTRRNRHKLPRLNRWSGITSLADATFLGCRHIGSSETTRLTNDPSREGGYYYKWTVQRRFLDAGFSKDCGGVLHLLAIHDSDPIIYLPVQ